MKLEKQDIKRQVARKVSIKEINEGKYVKQEGWEPNYVLLPNNEKVSRVNIIATITSSDQDGTAYNSMLLDDGTGSIEVRSFEDKEKFGKFSMGQIVNIIGRPRLFGDDKFIMPEIIKNIEDPQWIKVRSLEVKRDSIIHKTDYISEKIDTEKKDDMPVTEEKVEDTPKNHIYDEALQLIRKQDLGQGADTQKIISDLNSPEAEKTINKLLELGEIFETQPGKIKVLD